MTEQVQVVDAELPESARPATPRSGWALFALGLAVGVGAAVVFTIPTGSAPPVSTLAALTPTTVGSDERAQPGIGQVVDGFPDALVAVSRGSGSSLNHLLWPSSGPLTITPITDAEEADFDSSGRFVSLTTVVPGVAGEVLSIGRHNEIRSVAAGVTGHAWHDSSAGMLAFTAESEGRWRLSMVTGNFQPAAFLEGEVALGRVVAWGDWGFALQSAPSEVLLLTSAGEMKDTETGVILASHPSGWLFVHDGGPKLVTAGGGVIVLHADLAVGEPISAAFSPDGAKVAVAGSSGVSILDLETEKVEPVYQHSSVSLFSTASLAWSSDSRFLVSGFGTGLRVFDDAEDILQPVLRRQSLLAVAVAPPGGS